MPYCDGASHFNQKEIHLPNHSLHPPPPFLLGGLNHQPNFQKGGGFTGPQLLEGSC